MPRPLNHSVAGLQHRREQQAEDDRQDDSAEPDDANDKQRAGHDNGDSTPRNAPETVEPQRWLPAAHAAKLVGGVDPARDRQRLKLESAAEDLGLLGGELFFGEDALGLQLAELGELGDHVASTCRRRGRRRRGW